MGGIESVIAESQHLVIGEDKPIRWACKQSDGTTPQDCTGFTVEFKLMDRQGGTALVTKSATFQDHLGTADRIIVTIDAADWAAIPTKSAQLFYTLVRTDSGAVTMLAFGQATVHAALAVA